MKNKELADLLFDKIAEYLKNKPYGPLLKVSSVAGKSPRELLPSFCDIVTDKTDYIQVIYLNTIVGEAHQFEEDQKVDKLKKRVNLNLCREIVYHSVSEKRAIFVKDYRSGV